MTSMMAPMCVTCRHYRPTTRLSDSVVCIAFPEGIPADIFWEFADHRLPYAGDRGIRFEAKDANGAEYVEELYGPVELAEAAS